MTEVNGSEGDTSGNRTTLDANAGNGSSGTGSDWVAGLAAENRTVVEAKKWTSVDDALKSYRELEAFSSKALQVPGENATADELSKFYGKLGRPETADKYELKIDRSTLPADFPYDETLATNFRSWAHENGLNNKQAQAFHDKFVAAQADSFKAAQAKIAEQETAAHRDLVTKWGSQDSEGYKREVELMSRAAKQLGLTEALQQGGLLSADGGIRNATLALALARVGKELFSEDSFGSGGGGALNNPFAKDTFNLTEQGKLVRSDPNKARAFMRSAGIDPATRGL